VVPGLHLLNDRLTANELADRLALSSIRPSVKLTFPEGFSSKQNGERLEQNQVTPAKSFVLTVLDPAVAGELGVEGKSLEGFLFPATYEFSVDSDPKAIAKIMLRIFRERFDRLKSENAAAFETLRSDRHWSEHEIVTLASIVEKETADPGERPLVASVYLNRLDDAEFTPRGMLQADPTAAYGCEVAPRPSCAAGRVTPEMLRDADNPYNTYKHAGLPPGPIANPGEASIVAVLKPAKSDYLFFVRTGNGRHTFSRTLAEHNRAMGRD
jgi:UPF0755 protein